MSKIVRFHELGDADVLRIEDLPLEEPKAGVLVHRLSGSVRLARSPVTTDR